MILGVDHLCRASRDVNADIVRFSKQRYRVLFAGIALPVHAAKVPFLRLPSAAHDAVFLTSPGCVSVEVVRHDGAGMGCTPYDYRPGVGNVVSVACRCPAESERFWTNGLGFHRTEAPGECVFLSPVPAWRATVRLNDAPGTPDAYLDDEGWTCLSLIVRDVESVRRRLLPFIPEPAGEVYPLSFPDRSLSLCFLRGPSGEIVELLELKRKRACSVRSRGE